MTRARQSVAAASAVLLLGLLASGAAQAVGVVSAYADMAVGNLRFTFNDDPDAFVVWADDWFATVTAYAQDTD